MKQTGKMLTAVPHLCIFKFHVFAISIALKSEPSETSPHIFMFTRVRFNPLVIDCTKNKWSYIIKAFS